MTQLAAPRFLSPSDNRAYSIERHFPTSGWQRVAFAVSTREADKTVARKARENPAAKFRAVEADPVRVNASPVAPAIGAARLNW